MGSAAALRISLCLAAGFAPAAAAQETPDATSFHHALAQQAFYNARYESAAAHALAWRTEDPNALAAYELHSSALLFDLKRRLGDDTTKRRAPAACSDCEPLIAAFTGEVAEGQRLARARIAADPDDESAHFFLAKLGLNYLWLHNGLLGRRTGWREYREARRAIEHALEQDSTHLRARVALAWIDYIVDTRMPWGTKWLFGGGSRTRAVAAMRDASSSPGSFYDRAEARFGLWEMLVRERDLTGASGVARDLARDFPGNDALADFIAAQGGDPGIAGGAP